MSKDVLKSDEMQAGGQEVFTEIQDEMGKKGITPDYLVKRLKGELNAKETRLVKVKKDEKVEKVLEQIIEDMGGGKTAIIRGVKKVFETSEEIVVSVNMVNWGIRQKARMDIHKLRGDYPAEKKEHTGEGGGPIEVVVIDKFDTPKKKAPARRKRKKRG